LHQTGTIVCVPLEQCLQFCARHSVSLSMVLPMHAPSIAEGARLLWSILPLSAPDGLRPFLRQIKDCAHA
jgi:hypothetical protein